MAKLLRQLMLLASCRCRNGRSLTVAGTAARRLPPAAAATAGCPPLLPRLAAARFNFGREHGIACETAQPCAVFGVRACHGCAGRRVRVGVFLLHGHRHRVRVAHAARGAWRGGGRRAAWHAAGAFRRAGVAACHVRGRRPGHRAVRKARGFRARRAEQRYGPREERRPLPL